MGKSTINGHLNPHSFSAGDVEGEAEALLAAGSLHVLQEAVA